MSDPQVNGIKSYPLELALEAELFLKLLSEDKSIPIGMRLYAKEILRGLLNG